MSVTAIMNAVMRAYHSEHDRPPVFDDPLAAALLAPDERTRFEDALASSLPFVDPEAIGLDRDSALARSMRMQSGPVLFALWDVVRRTYVRDRDAALARSEHR